VIDQIDISLAVPSDASAIAQLSRDAIEHGLSWRWTARRVARSIRDSETNVVVARRGNHFLGFAILKYEDDEAHLLLMAVAPSHRRKGVASAMLGWLEATVQAGGWATIELEARSRNDEAIAFYRHHGFDEAGLYPGYYEGVEDARRMVKGMRKLPG
jgi:ribosomal-protein-alanine N-acetyltransferase